MPPYQQRLIFFDVDGVLIDGYHFNPRYCRLWTENIKTDLDIDPDEIKIFFKMNWSTIIVGQQDLMHALETFLLDLGSPVTAEEFKSYWFEHDAVVNARALALAKEWHKLPNTRIFIATNQEKYRAEYLWNQLKFGETFEDIFYSGQLGMAKDNPEFFETINRRLKVDLAYDNVVYFDDTPACLASARRAGWQHCMQVETADDLILPAI
jgi:putative hydrolase of the HAD superfamily